MEKDFKTITREELKKWIDEKKDFVLIDVLASTSYEARHILAAKSAPVGDSDFMQKAKALIPSKETIVIAYCSSAQCGASPRGCWPKRDIPMSITTKTA